MILIFQLQRELAEVELYENFAFCPQNSSQYEIFFLILALNK